jgi:hypothetical protein
LPFNYSINKTDLVVNYNNINYSWSDAVSSLYINDFIFGWDRISQTYNFIDKLEPGFGLWVYSYEVCGIWVENLTLVYNSYITDVEQKWNIISAPYNESINKADILLKYLGTDYSWSDAVSMGLVSDFIFDWNRTLQYYDFTDALEPGYAQWLYAYQPCMLKRVTF